jgi:hypothetical protein
MVAGFQSHGGTSDRDNLSREFVAQHRPGSHAEGGLTRHVQITTADAAATNPNHHLIG